MFPADEVPQANRVELILDLVVEISNRVVDEREVRNILRKRGKAAYVRRQGQYYAHAGTCIGLVVCDGDRYSLTRRGLAIVANRDQSKRRAALSAAIIETPFFATIIHDLRLSCENTGSRGEVASWVIAHTNLSDSTAMRRSSSVHRFLKYALENQ
jgi:hypothetical protein